MLAIVASLLLGAAPLLTATLVAMPPRFVAGTDTTSGITIMGVASMTTYAKQ